MCLLPCLIELNDRVHSSYTVYILKMSNFLHNCYLFFSLSEMTEDLCRSQLACIYEKRIPTAEKRDWKINDKNGKFGCNSLDQDWT